PRTPSSGPDKAFTIAIGATPNSLAWHFDAADREAAQLQFTGRNVAGDPMHLSAQFDAGVLRSDPLRRGRRQYGCLGAGIEEKKDRCAIGENVDDRLVIKQRNRHLAQANGSADADSIRGVGGSRGQRCRDDGYLSPYLDR